MLLFCIVNTYLDLCICLQVYLLTISSIISFLPRFNFLHSEVFPSAVLSGFRSESSLAFRDGDVSIFSSYLSYILAGYRIRGCPFSTNILKIVFQSPIIFWLILFFNIFIVV